LTPSGKQILNQVLPVAKNVDRHVLAALTAKEQEQLIALLQKIAVSPPSKTVGKVRTDIA
jgi:DNA-binding MarR family transcriptional regulator